MKLSHYLFLALIFILLTTTCKKEDDKVTVDDYPTSIDEYIVTNYPHAYIIEVDLLGNKEYEVQLCDGTELSFDLEGDLLNEEEGTNTEDCQEGMIDVSLKTTSLTQEGLPINIIKGLGELFHLEVTLYNEGNTMATGLQIRDSIPKGLEFIGSNTYDYDYNTHLWQVDTLEAGDSAKLNLRVKVVEWQDTTIYYTAQVHASDQADIDSSPANDQIEEDDQDQTTIAILNYVDISIETMVQTKYPHEPLDFISLGADCEFLMYVRNDGPGAATNIKIGFPIPPKTSFFAGFMNKGIWLGKDFDIPRLGCGEEAYVSLFVTVLEKGIIDYQVEVDQVDQFDVDSTPNNNDITEDDHSRIYIESINKTDLSISMIMDEPIPTKVGDLASYVIRLHNDGPGIASNMLIYSRIPRELTFHEVEHSKGRYSEIDGGWRIDELRANDSLDLRIQAYVEIADTITAKAYVSKVDQFDPDSTPGYSSANLLEEDDQDQVEFIITE